jgi:hypothetical protein
MSDLTPDLAAKVLKAEHRNLVKKVGEGGTLSPAERQMMIGFEAEGADPEALLHRRVTALLRKWLEGGRLTSDEKEEIAHVLPEAHAIYEVQTQIIPQGDQSASSQPKALTDKDAMQLYQLSRATYFRWKQHGASLPEGPDSPPWQDPVKMVAWYDRMRSRGIFKHKCPQALLDAARKPRNSEDAEPSKPQVIDRAASSPPAPRQASAKRGFLAELESLQEQTALLREDYEAALKAGETERAATLRAEYFSILETLRKYEKDKEQIATASGELVRKTEVEKDLAERLPAIVASLEYLIDTVDPVLVAEPDRAKRRLIWRRELAACFKGMATSRYAQPLSLLAA